MPHKTEYSIHYLYVFLYANKALLERIKARRIKHLLLDFCRVGTPAHEQELLLLGFLVRAFALMHVLEVEEAVAAVLGTARHYVGQE